MMQDKQIAPTELSFVELRMVVACLYSCVDQFKNTSIQNARFLDANVARIYEKLADRLDDQLRDEDCEDDYCFVAQQSSPTK